MGRYAMIRQVICVEKYWKVIVYYNIDYNFFDRIEQDMHKIKASYDTINDIHRMLYSKKAKAVTLSSSKKHISIILFNSHANNLDYINSIVHEAEHAKQAMLEAYDVEDYGEPPAYTIGYLVEKMYKVFSRL